MIGRLRRHRVGEEVGDVEQGLGLGGDGLGHRGMGVAERRDGQAAEEVEVATALVVPQLGAPAAHEHHLRRAEDGPVGAGVEAVGARTRGRSRRGRPLAARRRR